LNKIWILPTTTFFSQNLGSSYNNFLVRAKKKRKRDMTQILSRRGDFFQNFDSFYYNFWKEQKKKKEKRH